MKNCNFMKVLYIKRTFSDASHRAKVRKIKNIFLRKIILKIFFLLSEAKRFLFFSGVDGFFEAALHNSLKVKDVSYDFFRKMKNKDEYEILVVNYQAQGNNEAERDNFLKEIAENFSGPKVLFIDPDLSEIMPGDDVLDKYDLIFKREPFKDLNRYNISEENKRKIRPTVLSCDLFRVPKIKLPFFKTAKEKFENLSLAYENDVFFLGRIAERNNLREKVWERLRKENFKLAGGLIEKIKTIPENLKGKNLSQPDFLKTIKKSKINLAVEGIGQFTFRHLEIWAMGGFMLSSPSLREILTPLGAKEGVHYAVFEDLDDMVKKIKYYLEHEEEREKIARAGQEMFKRDYDARQHGDYIKNTFAGLLGAKNKKIAIITKRFHTNLYYRVKALQAAGFRISLIVWGREQSECHDIIKPFEIGFSPFSKSLNKLIEKIPNKKIVNFLKHNLPFVDLEEIINYKVLWKKLKEEKPGVALVRAYPGLTFFIMALFAKIFSKKVFLFAQLNKHYGETTRKKIYLFFLKNILRVKGIITPLENILAEKDPFFIYVPFAIEAPDFAKEHFRSGRINILSIGKFVRRKDQLLLLEVVNELKNSYNLSLTLIGEEREADLFQEIKDYIKNNNLEKIVDIRTNLPYKETLAAYKDFDLFVLPSHSEPAAYSPLEAMANKLPVVVSDTCGTKCYIKEGENGYIFKSRDKEDLKNKIELIIKDRENLIKLGERSFVLAKQKYSLEFFSEKLNKII